MKVDGTRMSHSSAYDQFVCRIWLTRIVLWSCLITSTYGILITAFERYFAVIHPIWYSVSVDRIFFLTDGAKAKSESHATRMQIVCDFVSVVSRRTSTYRLKSRYHLPHNAEVHNIVRSDSR